MSREAMKLALKALEVATTPFARDRQEVLRAQAALREALAEQPAEQEPYPLEEMQEEILRLSEIISTNSFYKAGHANALEWAAEMAVLEDPRTSDWVYDDPHELAKVLRKGPDFPSSQQPSQQLKEYDAGLLNDFGGGNVDWWQDYIRAELGRAYEHYQSQMAAPQPAQQEPVAWATQLNEYAHIKWGAKRSEYPIRYEVPLYTSPPPCPTCEALARTVMLDQTSHDAQRTWVGLTDCEREKLRSEADEADAGYRKLIKATEAKLREKNV